MNAETELNDVIVHQILVVQSMLSILQTKLRENNIQDDPDFNVSFTNLLDKFYQDGYQDGRHDGKHEGLIMAGDPRWGIDGV